MGTWLGHAAPGTFFICFALWWLVRTVHTYYSHRGHQYTNSLIKFCCCNRGCFSRLPLDNYVLIFVATLGVIMEVATSFASDGRLVMGNRQHLTMYISYGLCGLVSILVHHRLKFIPKGVDYLTLLMALIIELVLFRFHLHGREEVDVHVHMLLVYTITGCIVAVGIEMLYPHSINAGLARTYCFLLQGTWFCSIAFILYPPEGMTKWKLDEPENIMLVTLVFSWHMIGCLMVMLIISGVTYWCCSPKCRGDYSSSESEMNLLQNNGNTSKAYHNDDDDSAERSAIMKGYNSVASDEDELFTRSQLSTSST